MCVCVSSHLQAMYLVYRALENETVPMSLPPALVPQSKRKKSATPPALPLLPSPPSLKEGRTSQATAKALPPAATTITAPQVCSQPYTVTNNTTQITADSGTNPTKTVNANNHNNPQHYF